MCESPPGFEPAEVLKKRYPLVDLDYKPVFKLPLIKEGYGDDACCGRLEKTVDVICDRYNEPDGKYFLNYTNFFLRIHCVSWTWSVNWGYSSKFSKFLEICGTSYSN